MRSTRTWKRDMKIRWLIGKHIGNLAAILVRDHRRWCEIDLNWISRKIHSWEHYESASSRFRSANRARLSAIRSIKLAAKVAALESAWVMNWCDNMLDAAQRRALGNGTWRLADWSAILPPYCQGSPTIIGDRSSLNIGENSWRRRLRIFPFRDSDRCFLQSCPFVRYKMDPTFR